MEIQFLHKNIYILLFQDRKPPKSLYIEVRLFSDTITDYYMISYEAIEWLMHTSWGFRQKQFEKKKKLNFEQETKNQWTDFLFWNTVLVISVLKSRHAPSWVQQRQLTLCP